MGVFCASGVVLLAKGMFCASGEVVGEGSRARGD